jgi:hypothetical protein
LAQQIDRRSVEELVQRRESGGCRLGLAEGLPRRVDGAVGDRKRQGT